MERFTSSESTHFEKKKYFEFYFFNFCFKVVSEHRNGGQGLLIRFIDDVPFK